MTKIFTDDIRFARALDLFNSENWYEAHDLLEEIWHETTGDQRQALQAILQISVAQFHLENNNTNGALILYGEALNRLRKHNYDYIKLNLMDLYECIQYRLDKLQNNISRFTKPIPTLCLLD